MCGGALALAILLIQALVRGDWEAWIYGGAIIALVPLVALSRPGELIGLGWPLIASWPDHPSSIDLRQPVVPLLSTQYVDAIVADGFRLDTESGRLSLEGELISDEWSGLALSDEGEGRWRIEALGVGAGYRAKPPTYQVSAHPEAKHALCWAMWRACSSRGWTLRIDGAELSPNPDDAELQALRPSHDAKQTSIGMPPGPGAHYLDGPRLGFLTRLSHFGGTTLLLLPWFWLIAILHRWWPRSARPLLSLVDSRLRAEAWDTPLDEDLDQLVYLDPGVSHGVVLLEHYAVCVSGTRAGRRGFMASVVDRRVGADRQPAADQSAPPQTPPTTATPEPLGAWRALLTVLAALGKVAVAVILSGVISIPIASTIIQRGGLRDIGWGDTPVGLGLGFGALSLLFELIFTWVTPLKNEELPMSWLRGAILLNLPMFVAKVIGLVGILGILYASGLVTSG